MTPSDTRNAGKTPDSRSKIVHPSARTVSLTQNGIKHSKNISERTRLRAILAIVQATGKHTKSVSAVDTIDITAVRKKVCKYRGSSMNMRYCAKLGSYTRGAKRTRSDKYASSICGRMISPTSHKTTGANSSKTPSRISSGPLRFASACIRRSKTNGVLGIEAKAQALSHLQSRVLPGLGQGDAQGCAAVRLPHQNGGIRAVK